MDHGEAAIRKALEKDEQDTDEISNKSANDEGGTNAAYSKQATEALERQLWEARAELAEYAASKAQEASALEEDAERALNAAIKGDKESAQEAAKRLKEALQGAGKEAEQVKSKNASSSLSNGVVHGSTATVGEGPDDRLDDEPMGEDGNVGLGSQEGEMDMEEWGKWVPLRLTLRERKQLRLVEAALSVSDYVDKVDVVGFKAKTGRVTKQLKEMCAVLCGMAVANDFKAGRELVEGREFKDNQAFFTEAFEIARRHKHLNPETMRSEYAKILYLLMDSQSSDVKPMTELNLVSEVKTVGGVLATHGMESMLRDHRVKEATAEITPRGKSRSEVQKAIKRKEKAREELARTYSSSSLPKEEIERCLYSLNDASSYLAFNRGPVDEAIRLLRTYFRPDSPESGYSLAITVGVGGARLTHNHARQFQYVLQSMTLWREVLGEMNKLWSLAEADMLREGNEYRLMDTGQGLNRVQQSPKLGKAIHSIVARCQKRLGTWIGSSVVHLGDHNVPNAFLFIHKYLQVPQILSPLVGTIREIDTLVKSPGLRRYIDSEFGGPEALRKEILSDFFRHAFDGSGADSFMDAGSCVDGRLTSAWNWCHKIDKKRFYPIFKLAGFHGFDGDFR